MARPEVVDDDISSNMTTTANTASLIIHLSPKALLVATVKLVNAWRYQ